VGTKTTSIRLEQDLIDEIDSKCSELDCTRNDFIKSTIESALEQKDDDVEHKPYHDSLGNRWYWSYDSKNWVCEINPNNMRVVP